jgi:hypothetical protein
LYIIHVPVVLPFFRWRILFLSLFLVFFWFVSFDPFTNILIFLVLKSKNIVVDDDSEYLDGVRNVMTASYVKVGLPLARAIPILADISVTAGWLGRRAKWHCCLHYFIIVFF